MNEQELAALRAELLASMLEEEEAQLDAAQPALAPVARDGNLPLSFAQQRLWFFGQFEAGNVLYNIPAAMRLSGALDVAALARTVNEVVRRHEALRTTFEMVDKNAVQIIAPALELALAVTDLCDLPEAQREQHARTLIEAEARLAFDLAAGPLIRARLLRLREDQHIVLFTVHHIVSDGWSMGVLVQEVAALYAAFVQDRPSPLPELAIQYADFAHWQRRWLSGDVLARQLDYWTGKLAGAPALLTLPTDRPRPAMQSFRGALFPFAVDAATTRALHALGQQQQATLFMTLTAAFNVLLARYSGQSDICVGTPIANRNRAETEALIGFFVNTLVLRTELDPDASFIDLLQQVRASALSAYAHQDVPFEQLVEALKPERNLSHSALFQVAIALQNAPMEQLELPGLRLQSIAADSATAKFDLTLNIVEQDGALACTFEYSSDLFDVATVERLSGHFAHLLAAIAAAPLERIGRLNMLSTAEQDLLAARWREGEAASRVVLLDPQGNLVPVGVPGQVHVEAPDGSLAHPFGAGTRLAPTGDLARHLADGSIEHLGRVDQRHAGNGTAGIDVAYLAPRTQTEIAIAAIWSEVLEIEQVGVNDNFFALGGHSLLVAVVISHIEAELDVAVPIEVFFAAQTVALIAAHVDAATGSGEAARLPAIALQDRNGPLALSFAQQRLWFLDQFETGSAFYNMPVAVRLLGALDVAALTRTVGEVVQRHEALRTSFATVDGAPRQAIAASLALPLPVTDLAELPPAEREQRAASLIGDEARTPFDLGTGPLLRVRLLRLRDDEHIAQFTMHHIVSDGWSMGVLVREVAALYAAYVQGQPSPLAPLAIQYADFAHWQRAWLSGDVLARQLDYWTGRLAGAPTLLALPTDRPRPAVQSYQGALLPFAVPAHTTSALNALGQQQQATLFMTLSAAFNVLLARYSGQTDICLGTPIANRNRAETEALIGFFVNTLVIRSEVDLDAPFTDLLQQVRANALGAYAHQDVPFEQLVDAVKPERHLSHTPLFQVMLALQNAPLGKLDLPGLTMQPLEADSATAKFDLTLNVIEQDGSLHCAFEYNTDLFDASTIERMASHFGRLLDAIVQDPAARSGQLCMLAEAERTQLLVEWNRTALAYPHSETLARLFERQAELSPHQAAASHDGEQLSYAQLNLRANQVAHYLRAQGVGPDSLVGLCLERSLDMVVAMLGIVKAGAAYLPLDPDYPQERLAFMLADAKPVALLMHSRLQAMLPDHAIPTLWMDGEPVDQRPADNPAPAALPSNLAYVIYTSGSTGRPKGVGISQQAVKRLVYDTAYVSMQAGDRIAQVANSAFDAITFELWGALLHGCELCIISRDTILSPHTFTAALRDRQIDTMFLTTALFNQVANACPDGFAHLGQLLFGGEAVDPHAVDAVLRAGPPARLLHVYGPTECTTFALWHQIDTVQADANTIPLGRPITNTQTYILDGHGNPVPVGVPGELHLAGDGLARGYLDRPELTAATFIANPFSSLPGERMYRTGDLARYLPGGAIEYLGRIDDQVKIRGLRIELGEITAALAALPELRDALVVAREDQPGDKRLVAYLVEQQPSGSPQDAIPAIRATLLRSLPEYMVPAHYVFLDCLPLTPNGKIDRRALPAPDMTRGEAGLVAPRTAAEATLAAIWADILQLDQVGVTDNFFALGGHSLLATQLLSRVQAAFAVTLPLRALFEAATVETQAARILQAAADGCGAHHASMLPVARDGAPALSFAQQRLWFLDQFDSDSASYNIPAAIRLTGALDVAAMTRTFNDVVQRHEALRTTFSSADGAPLQTIAGQLQLALPLHDLSALPDQQREARAKVLIDAEAQAPFDLEHGPLIRASLLRLGADQHIALFTMHHIVSDGWSMGVLVREVASLYGAHVEGKTSPLAPLAIQYADYAHWQRQWLAGDTLARQLDYWTDRLTGAPTLLALPTDRPRPAVQSFSGATLAFTIARQTTAALHALGQQQQSTLFMTLGAAFNVLLARYSGQTDICLGTPIANRNRAETEALIGFFVNTLVIRSEVDLDAPFTDLLQQVRANALGAYAHQDVPFEQLVDAVKPERHLSHTPLFQVMLALQNAPMGTLELPGLTLEPLSADSATAKFDLTLNIAEQDGALVCHFEYCTALFDGATIARMAGHFGRLLDAIVAAPATPNGQLSMLDAAERQHLTGGLNDTATVYPRQHSLQAMFEARAEKAPRHTALVFEGKQLCYAELNARANRLAHHLRALGAGPDSLVALCSERSIDMVVALLAILKAGAAYVPLDPAYPQERLANMLADARPVALLTQQHLDGVLPAHAIPTVVLDRIGNELDTCPDTNLAQLGVASNLAYVIFTSGSTGRPKGVGIDQAGIVNRLQWMQEAYRLTPQDRVLQKTPFSFDVSVWEFFWPLTYGATLVVARPGGHQDVDYLAQIMAAEAITTMHFVPPMLEVFLNGAGKHAFPALRQIMCSGQALPLELQNRCLAALPHVGLHNLYGPTEASVDVTFWHCQSDAGLFSVPIGRPIANTQIYLLDAALNPVPVGVAGHLHIAGVGLARGYLSRPELTAATFIANPFSTVPGARMYRSGDLARYLPDGAIEYLGRIDDQVKIRGLRIELGEIETALAAMPAVRDALVLAREDRLIAYLVEQQPSATPQDTVASIRNTLLRTLPDYMVPASFVFLDKLPLTPNGKVDRRALPAPDAVGTDALYVAPRTPTEAALAGIWAEVLKREQIGVTDNFFALGGHSLLATQLVSKVRAAFSVDLPLRALFEAATVETLAARLDLASPADQAPPMVAVVRDAAPALSFAQQRLWFLDQFERGSAFYNMPMAVRFTGALDVPALTRTVNAIIDRHEILRTTFATSDGAPLQRIGASLALELPVYDLSDLPPAEREARAGQLMHDEARSPFDLATGPLLRVQLLRMRGDEHIGLFTMHHIVSDGWSMGVLVQEVAALYGAYVRGEASPLPPLAIQYADFAHWQRQWLSGDVLARQLDYWTERLAGAPTLLALPTDRQRPAVQTFSGATLPFAVGAATTASLLSLGKQHRSTLFMTLAAAFNVLLARYSGQSDICLGTPIANRQRAETEALIGFFVNTLVLRSEVDLAAPFTELLQQVRGNALSAYAHQDVPFEQLVDAVKPERHMGHTPLFQVMLALQNAPMGELALPGLTLQALEADSGTAKFDLTLNVIEQDGVLNCSFEYNTDLFDATTIARMAGHLQHLFDAIARAPSTACGQLAMVADAERTQLMVEWNRTELAYPHSDTLAQLFEQQAATHPERTAASHDGELLGYAELNRRANQVARHLVALGVQADDLVGLCVERSLDMVIGMLGIIKAGAAYLPLDPGYPEQRLAFMLDDARPAALLVHSQLQAMLPAHAIPTLCLDTERHLLDPLASDNLSVAATPANLAYVIYTSGSTGRPKGVSISQQAVKRLVYDTRYVSMEAGDRIAQVANSAFDAITFELWGALLHGCQLCIFSRDTILSPHTFTAALRDQQIDTMFLTTALFNQVANACPDGFAHLGQLLFGGEAVDPRAVDAVLRAGAPARLLHVYGPTECTTFALWHQIDSVQADAITIALGRPIANTQAYILDALGNPVPVGVAGELHLAGDGLARDYLNRPELTAEKFVANPFSTLPGARMYRTGDLARYLPDGAIEYLGRIDDQVKIRGLRIELGEITAALAALPELRDALVVAREDQPGDKRLVAYLVEQQPSESPQDAIPAMRAALLRTLPEYMVPAHYVFLDYLPLTPNGKIDRRALPAPDMSRGSSGYVAPSSATEIALAGLWAELLKLDQVGVNDNFFQLGGHSLLATQLVSRLRTALGIDLPLRTLFESPTISALAEHIDQAPGAQLPPIVAVDRASPLALSFAQQRLWFLSQFNSGGASYNIPSAIRLSGALDVAALTRTVNDVVQRHEALRATFATIDGAPLQIIAEQLHLALPLLDLSDLPHAEREAHAAWLIQDEAQTPFALDRGPLIRARLLRLSEDQHIALFTMHHIVSDGWSMGVLVQEVAALYAAHVQGIASPLAPLIVQYADFAHWQRQWLAGDTLSRQLDYWTSRLAGAPTLLALPTDRPRPAVQSFSGALLPFAVAPATTAALHALGREQQATLFMTLTAAFNVLLARYSGQTDICVGTPIANRNRAETEALIGFFVNTLVLRSEVDLGAPFTALLQQVRGHALGAYAHQDVPFEQLVDAVKPERHLSHTPLFQVMLALQNAPFGKLALPGLTLEPLLADSATAKFDLTLNIAEHDGALACHFEYSTELFDEATIQRMAGHFTRLLDAIVAAPATCNGQLAMLDATETAHLVAGWNSTATHYPEQHSLQAMFEAQVELAPRHTALVFENEQLDYAALNARANRLAHHLRAQGAGPDCLVAICTERSIDMVVGLLAILKAGAAYVPLDPAYPKDRLAYMLADARPAALLTQRHLHGVLPEHAIATIVLDDIGTTLDDYPATNLAHTGIDSNLAYVIYTSGSTGRPKGVGIDQAGIVNRLQWMQEAYRLTPQDRVLQKTPFSFDVSVWEFFWPLTYGATLVVARPGGHQDVEYLAALMADEAITTMHFVPPMLEVFLNGAGKHAFPALRQIMCSGQALPLELQNRCLAALPHVGLHNLYGPTEASVDVTFWHCQSDAGLFSVPIGRPIANTQIYLLDPELNPVPVGVAGHLHIAGVGLARGYLNRPELTAATFIANPFSTVPGARMYRSGDLARFLPNGAIEYLGRIDDQVKIRGLRIELGEIETALAALPAMRDALVLAREDRLVAYLVEHQPSAAPQDTVAGIRATLLRTLPDYMVPAHYVFLDALPLTPNGKVDRRALPAPDTGASCAEYVAPRTANETALAGIWAEVLKLEQVGVTDNYFALGGDSMRSIAILSKARALGMPLQLEHIFKHQTIEAIAQALPASGDTGHELAAVELIAPADLVLLPEHIEDAYRLSRLQLGMLFHNELTPELGTYHDVISLQFSTASWDMDAFRTALDAMVRKHPILRTGFDLHRYSEPLQLVHKAAAVPLSVIDLRGVADQEVAIARWIEEEKRTPFNIEAAPLLRVFIHLRTATTLQYSLSFHHAILDGWSVASLQSELIQEYVKLSESGARTLTLAPLASSYKSGIAAELRALQSAATRAFWDDYLAGHALSTLPGLLAEPQEQAPVKAVDVAVSGVLRDGLATLANDLHVPLRTVLLAAHVRVMAILCGTTDVVTGLVAHSRAEEADGDKVLGLFLNTLPYRAQVGTGSWQQLVRATFDNELRLVPHRSYPYAQLFIDNGRLPLYETAFNFINFHVYEGVKAAAGNSAIEVIGGETFEATNFAFCLNASNHDNKLNLGLIFDPARLSPAQVDDIGHLYLAVLQSMAGDPERQHHDQDYLSDAVRHRLLHTWNATERAYAHASTIAELFEGHAARAPDNIAASHAGGQLSYGQLNARANRVAHYLRSHGVGPDQVVGICVERSLDMVVGMLGIAKSGAAYLPLDPDYPQERLAYMLESAQPAALLTQDALRASLPEHAVPVLCLDREDSALAAHSADNPARLVLPDNLAIVLYTSGSTGRPKGVSLSHKAVMRLVSNPEYMDLRPGDKMAQTASSAFDAITFELWAALVHGCQLCIIAKDVILSPQALAATVREQEIDILFLTTALLNHVAGECPQAFARVRHILFGGEAADPRAVDAMERAGAPGRLLHFYGPAESTTFATWHRVEPVGANAVTIPLGRPVANTQVYLLDAHHNPVPLGVCGEVYIGGVGLARGYMFRPDLTAERFIANPFSTIPGSRMYQTGDLARYLADGKLEYMGRIDDQVKIRGLRIELGEIATALNALPELRDAVVLVREDTPGDKRLVAYAIAQQATQDPQALVAPIRTALLRTLPAYMVPAHFVFLDRLPITPNGKLDRRALPAPDTSRIGSEHVAPRTPTEATLAGIWSELLKLDQIGVHDNFFALGGHSLQCVQLLHHIKANWNTSIALASIFTSPTLAALASVIDARQHTASLLVPLQAHGDGPALFCVHPVGGNVFAYRELAIALGTGFPVYGLQSPEFADVGPQCATLAEMALVYTTAIREHQPEGPYRLLGWSSGGLFALAIAHALEAQGCEVQYVGLLDTLPLDDANAPQPEELLRAAAVNILEVVRAKAFAAAELTVMGEVLTRHDLTIAEFIDARNHALALPYLQQWTGTALTPETLRHLARQLAISAHHLSVLAGYTPAPVRAHLQVLWARDSAAAHSPYAYHAAEEMGDNGTALVDGNHYTMVSAAHAQSLAHTIGQQLASLTELAPTASAA